MANFSLGTHIAANPSDVFATVTDFEKACETIGAIKKIEMLTDGPVGKGTRFRETREVFKREATEEMEIVEFDAGSHYTIGCTSCGCEYKTVVRCTPDAGGTRLEYDMTTRPVTLVAKLTGPIMGVLFGGTMKKCMKQELEDIKGALEA